CDTKLRNIQTVIRLVRGASLISIQGDESLTGRLFQVFQPDFIPERIALPNLDYRRGGHNMAGWGKTVTILNNFGDVGCGESEK
ncbi:hypothetical protein, partial [Lyngbya sp. CCY1209]|uniref:hypothetical protein n=1 Tax=Lyngbya sp. CCY1209 TaxID=2886103 RepID=UPI002D204288